MGQHTLPRNLPLMKHRVVTFPSSSRTHSKIRSGTSACGCGLFLVSGARSLSTRGTAAGRSPGCTSPTPCAVPAAADSRGADAGGDARCVFTLDGSASRSFSALRAAVDGRLAVAVAAEVRSFGLSNAFSFSLRRARSRRSSARSASAFVSSTMGRRRRARDTHSRAYVRPCRVSLCDARSLVCG